MKVQNEMSTRVSVETVAAIGSLKAFRNAITATSNAWRAQETALKNSGNYSEAVRSKISGLNKVMELQRAKIKELRSEQEGLDTSNKEQATQFLKLEKQISQANKQLASYDGQARRAKSAAAYQVSGLASLQSAYRSAQSSSNAYVERLKAEGKNASSTVAHFRNLKNSLANLESQYRKQEFMLKQVANASGRDSEAYRKQKEQLDKTATSIAKTKNEMKSLRRTVAGLQPTGINRIDNAVLKINDHTGRMKAKFKDTFTAIRQGASGVANTIGVITVGLVDAAKKASSLQKTYVENQNLMTTAGEKSADAQKEVNQMYSQGEKLSVQYGVSQKAISDGYQTLIKRGYDGKQSLGAMNSILKASKASGDDFDDTMRVTTSTLEAFGMKVDSTKGMMQNTAKVADTLAKAADVTSTSFKDIGEAMTYAGPSAKATGVSLKETSAILGVLSNNGLEATEAGTGLQRILTRLAAPTDTAKASLKQYNMSIDDFKDKSGKLKPVSDIFKEINQHVPKAERLEFFNKVFGQTAQNAASIISSSTKDLDHVNSQLESAYKEDYAGKLAEKNMKAAKNSSDRFKYAMQAVQIELGRNMLPAISKASQSMAEAFMRKDTQNGMKEIAKGIGNMASALVSFVTLVGKHTTTVKVFGSALLLAFANLKVIEGIGRIKNAISILKELKITTMIIKSFSVAIRGVGAALKFVTAGFNPWVIAIEAVVVAITLLYTHSKTFRKMCSEMGKLAVKAGKTIVKGFKAVVNWFKSDWKQIALFLVNPIAGGIALLYKHNKKFRGFVNGLGKIAKTGLKKVGHFFSSSSKNIQKTSSRMWKGITKTTKTAWRNQIRENQRGLKDARKTWNTMSRNVQRTSKNMWNRASRDARNGWNYVARWGNRSSKDVAKTWDWMNRQTTRAAQRMFQKHKRTFKAGYKVIEDQTKTWKDLTSGHWDRLADDTRRTANDMNKFHQRLFKDMYSKLNDMTDGRLGDMVKSWQDKMGSIGDTVANAKQAIHTHFVDLVRGIIKPFNDMLGGIQKGINWVLDKLGAPKIGGTWQVPMPSYATGTQGAHPGGFAKVNDGKTGHYRELYRLPNGVVGMFPAVRDMIVPLPKGTSILDGERSYSLMRMMGKIPHYADGVGVLSDMFSNIVNSAGDALDGMMEDVDKIMSHPIEFMESVFKKFIRVSTPVKFASDLITYVPKFIAKQMGEWIKKQFATLTNPGGAGVERWRPYIIRAFHQLGVEPVAWKVEKLLRQIATESGGNPLAFQHGYVDANTGGNEARGLLQFAGSTWAADALPGHTDWRNGYNEILAAIHVLERGGEGGWGNVGNGHGWENGGLINKHGMYEVGEYNRPEMIVPLDMSKRSRAYQLLGEIVARFHAEEPAYSAATTSTDDHRELRELNTKFDKLLGMFGQLLNLNGGQLQAIKDQGTFDVKQLYKRQARDAAMRAYS